jgi:mannan endo-1,4-beta-mannosidase
MRWPNRKPHVLTRGMRREQSSLAGFMPLIDWSRFRRVNLNEEIEVSHPRVAVFGCGDSEQAFVWLLRRDTLARDGTLSSDVALIAPRIGVPGLTPGRYRITGWDTAEGRVRESIDLEHGGGPLSVRVPPFATDLALAIRRM